MGSFDRYTVSGSILPHPVRLDDDDSALAGGKYFYRATPAADRTTLMLFTPIAKMDFAVGQLTCPPAQRTQAHDLSY